MADELKRVRKGTKSCTECRRRKVRCTWSSDDAPRCRRCEERGSNCVAQIFSLRSANSRKPSSRDRIARLEQQVLTLSKALTSETGTNSQNQESLESPDRPITIPEEESESGTSDYDSDESETFRDASHHHLGMLFENDVLSLDTSKKDAHDLHREKAISDLRAGARRKLQELIPPKQDVDIIASYATQWLSVFHALFPAPSMIKNGEDMVNAYDAVKTSQIDTAFLASWLMSLAMTIHQVPKGALGPESQVKGFRNPIHFTKSVSDAVEDTIMKHDALLGTIQGIDAAMLFLRLQLSRGNFKKTWLMMRKVIAVAELIGLHRAARRADLPTANPENGNFWFGEVEQSSVRKAQVWESLCSVDRIAGMLFNLPPGTRRYRLPSHTHILADGKLNLRAYLCSLSDIAMRVQDLEDFEIPEDGDTSLYAQVLKVDGEMRVLASITPAAWWHHPEHITDHLLQYWHYYITIRVHLPFTLRHDTSEQFSFSRLACLKACTSLVDRYKSARSLLPQGFFLCRVIDLQTFTALVVLILAYHASTPAEKANLHAQGARSPELSVPEVLEFMKTLTNEIVAEYARQAVVAVGQLMQLLGGEGTASLKEDLKLKVPLLGKLHIRRKQQHTVQLRSKPPAQGQVSQPNSEPVGATSYSSAPSMTNTSSPFDMGSSMMGSAQDDYPWDPLSWSIEDDRAGAFQDAVMMEDFPSYIPWWDQNNVAMMPGTNVQQQNFP